MSSPRRRSAFLDVMHLESLLCAHCLNTSTYCLLSKSTSRWDPLAPRHHAQPPAQQHANTQLDPRIPRPQRPTQHLHAHHQHHELSQAQPCGHKHTQAAPETKPSTSTHLTRTLHALCANSAPSNPTRHSPKPPSSLTLRTQTILLRRRLHSP